MSRPFIELYIDSKKVEFKEPPKVLITYAHQDLHNPTVVKNSFSKTITVEGTPHNNQIFGCFYDMTRITGYDDVYLTGAYFNASRKVPFELYRNGEMMEQGYIKLDKVTKKGNEIQYSITLYGGLGEFLYNLQYKEDGEQMRLSDLDFGFNMDMEITKETVYNAWKHLTEPNPNVIYSLYDTINFAPCYNGIPKDFGADKVALDMDTMSVGMRNDLGIDLAGKEDNLLNGRWMLGELKKEYDEWQTKDLRSYLQRPIIRFKDIIQACCKKDFNGGYTVDLDEDFFNENNPYYEGAWMTLPLVTEIESDNESDIGVIAENNTYYVEGGNEGDLIKVKMSVTPALVSKASTSTIRTGRIWYKELEGSGDITGYPFYNQYKQNIGRCLQLVVRDKDGKVIGGSSAQAFATDVYECNDFNFYLPYDAPINYNFGTYQRIDEENTFAFNKGIYDFEVDVEYQEGMYFEIYQSYSTISAFGDNTYKGMMFDDKNNGVSDFIYGYGTHIAEAKMVKKKRMITKKTLLNSEKTPCDYFLSYLKMFNLHIWKDMYDKIIYVRLRRNFFNGERYDLDDFVDRGKNITITPLTFENKWYNFKLEANTDEKFYKEYLDAYGLEYGIQKVDTNYNFDSSSKELFDKNVFKGCIMARERSRYFTNIYNKTGDYRSLPPYMMDGVQTFIFNEEGDTVEDAYITPKKTATAVKLWKQKFYDVMPKPNFTNNKNEGVDGANVLLFFNGSVEMDDVNGKWIGYYLTDDIAEFEQLNDGEPCWIYVGGNNGGTISLDVARMPLFSRYLVNENSWVTHSWDFGTPKNLYIPDYSIDESSNIYTQYWQPYIKDMYNVDTRIVECDVLLRERVVGDWLRRFYYWDGSYFILNKISDYDVTSNDTTKCEFVRVQNMNNYLI